MSAIGKIFDPKDMKLVDLPKGELLILECDRPISMDRLEQLKDRLKKSGIDRKLVILDQGIRASMIPQLERIETKLDILIEALESAAKL